MTGREYIAKRTAEFFEDGDMINLGIGMPTNVANYVPENVDIVLQSENGFIGIGPTPSDEDADPDVVNAGGHYTSIIPGGCVFDSSTSFGLIRGGHVTKCVLGALEVDQNGNLANWIIPDVRVPGIGGGMDLVNGARTVIINMEHCTKTGQSKILKKCTLPLTAVGQVDYIVTDLGVMHCTSDGMILEELAPGISLDEFLEKTEAEVIISDQIRNNA